MSSDGPMLLFLLYDRGSLKRRACIDSLLRLRGASKRMTGAAAYSPCVFGCVRRFFFPPPSCCMVGGSSRLGSVVLPLRSMSPRLIVGLRPGFSVVVTPRGFSLLSHFVLFVVCRSSVCHVFAFAFFQHVDERKTDELWLFLCIMFVLDFLLRKQ